jgi:hypothetical protein
MKIGPLVLGPFSFLLLRQGSDCQYVIWFLCDGPPRILASLGYLRDDLLYQSLLERVLGEEAQEITRAASLSR